MWNKTQKKNKKGQPTVRHSVLCKRKKNTERKIRSLPLERTLSLFATCCALQNTQMMRWWVYYSVFNVYVSQFYRASIWLHWNGFERSAPDIQLTIHQQLFASFDVSFYEFLSLSFFTMLRVPTNISKTIFSFTRFSGIFWLETNIAKANMTAVSCNASYCCCCCHCWLCAIPNIHLSTSIRIIINFISF